MDSTAGTNEGIASKLRNWSIATIIAAIMAFFPINKAYVDWHANQARTIAREEMAGLKESINETQATGQQTANKVDFLIKSEAARMVDNLNTQLILLESRINQTPYDRREIAALRLRIDSAIKYRDCVLEDGHNCDALRVWQ